MRLLLLLICALARSCLSLETYVRGPSTPKPDYTKITSPIPIFGRTIDNFLARRFRDELAKVVLTPNPNPNPNPNSKDPFPEIITLAETLNSKCQDRKLVRALAQDVLTNCFPRWLTLLFPPLFALPFPAFTARANAWATKMFGFFLVGEGTINDVVIDGGGVGAKQGLLVTRCRFLEEAGCASICVNACKVPTEKFMLESLGVPLTMTPDYKTFECQFAFGLSPTEDEAQEAIDTRCLSGCPRKDGGGFCDEME